TREDLWRSTVRRDTIHVRLCGEERKASQLTNVQLPVGSLRDTRRHCLKRCRTDGSVRKRRQVGNRSIGSYHVQRVAARVREYLPARQGEQPKRVRVEAATVRIGSLFERREIFFEGPFPVRLEPHEAADFGSNGRELRVSRIIEAPSRIKSGADCDEPV